MAIIKEMVGEKIISGFKGVIDYYYYMGLACARRWPKSPGHIRSPAVMAQWPAWSYAAKTWHLLPLHVQEAYKLTAHSTDITGFELFMKAFTTGDFIKLE